MQGAATQAAQEPARQKQSRTWRGANTALRAKKTPLGPDVGARGFLKKIRQRPTLPRGFPRSTIGSGGLNFRVRDGNGCDPSDIATGKSV